MDEIFIEPLLEQYDLETLDPRDRRDLEHINVLEGIAALEQLALTQDEVEQLQQITEIEKLEEEKLNQKNESKNWEQQQLIDFERLPTTKQDQLLQDEMEHLRQ
ncbi:unnamed protein product, partial [Rotaria sp. Silwood2]